MLCESRQKRMMTLDILASQLILCLAASRSVSLQFTPKRLLPALKIDLFLHAGKAPLMTERGFFSSSAALFLRP